MAGFYMKWDTGLEWVNPLTTNTPLMKKQVDWFGE